MGSPRRGVTRRAAEVGLVSSPEQSAGAADGPGADGWSQRRDTAKADGIHGPLAAIVSMQTSLDAFLAVEKHLLVRQGIFKNTLVRGPVGFHLDEETKREVDRLFDRLMVAAES